MNNKFGDDDGLYDLIGAGDCFGNGSDTCRTDDLMFNTNHIDWNHIRVNENQHVAADVRDNFNALNSVTNNLCDDVTEVLSARSKLVNDRAEANMHIYMPRAFQKDIFNDGAKADYCLCRECGGQNNVGLVWCLFCGELLIKAHQVVSSVGIRESFCNEKVKWRNVEVEELLNTDKGRVKLDLGGFETVRSSTDDKWDFDLDELGAIESVVTLPQTMVPPLDLSVLDSSRGVEESKENIGNAVWNRTMSSTAWIDNPDNLLQKKQSAYYRNKLNSCTNKMGINVFKSGIGNEVIPQEINEVRKTEGNTEENGVRNKEELVTLPKGRGNGIRKRVKNGVLSSICDCYRHKEEQVTENTFCNRVRRSEEFGSRKVEENCLERSFWNGARKSKENSLERSLCNGIQKSEETSIHKVVMDPNCVTNNQLPVVFDCSQYNDTTISQWQCLPAEIWIKVMHCLKHSELSHLQQTCRRIYHVGLDSSLWRSVSLYRHITLSDSHIFYIAKKSPKELHFKNCFGTNITNDGLEEMFKICGQGLKKISFISCSKGAFEDDVFLVKSAIFCPNVTHINASYLMNFQDETLKQMIKGFIKIESLNIMGAHSISNQSIKTLIEYHRASLINLDFYGCFKLNSSTLPLLEQCLNLQSLALGSINNLKRSTLIDMLKKLSQLIILDLRGTMNLVDDSLLLQICQSCPKLQQIVLTNSSRLTDDGVIGLAKSCVCTSLKILDICGCSKITERGLEQVLKQCRELEDLDISCTGIKGDGAKYFKTFMPPKLKCLRINNNKFITVDELFVLIRSCKKLNTIYMCGSTSIGSWRTIEEQFPNVTFKHE